MKPCRDCSLLRPINDFYKHPEMADGHLNKCIDCVKKRVGNYREKNLERVRGYDRSRGNRQSDGYVKNYRKENPEIYKAHYTLSNAVRDGMVEKPSTCSDCGKKKKIVGHHLDYSKPLNVVWMCQGCHKKWHAKFDL